MAITPDQLFIKLLAKRIKELRIQAGYTSQETFAYDAEIPRAQYGRYEKGVNLNILSLSRIVTFHKLSFEEFFAEGFEEYNGKIRK